jgi:putative membrane-bound dehydrogenase-like protein
MTLPPGFRAQVFAAEPDVRQPVAIAIDARGRVFVAEAMAYPQRRPDGQGEDRIVVFTDRDGDGTPEERTVFLSGLNLVSGLAVGHGGVWVGAAPELLFVPDRDGDLVPDGPAEVVLDGFGLPGHARDAELASPGAPTAGSTAATACSRTAWSASPRHAGRPSASAERGVWRCTRRGARSRCSRGAPAIPWGVDFDARGQAFLTACVIPHLFHVVQGGVYHRQSGEHFDRFVYQDLATIADHRHHVGDDTHAGNRISGTAGGGHAHCGALIQRGGCGRRPTKAPS